MGERGAAWLVAPALLAVGWLAALLMARTVPVRLPVIAAGYGARAPPARDGQRHGRGVRVTGPR